LIDDWLKQDRNLPQRNPQIYDLPANSLCGAVDQRDYFPHFPSVASRDQSTVATVE
jgi:hypothetical protein